MTLEHDKTEHMSFANAIYMCAIVLFFKNKKCAIVFHNFKMSGNFLLQEVGCNHAQIVGFSTDGFATTTTMRKYHLIWVTARMHIEVYKYPAWLVLFFYNARFETLI